MTALPALDLWVDLVCPWCRLNHERLQRARAELASDGVVFDVIYRPFQLAPGQPAGVTRKEHFTRAFGDIARADAAFEHVRSVGAAEGVDFRFDLIELEPNTMHAHRLVRFAQELESAPPGAQADVAATAVAGAIYEAFFVEGRDIVDVDTLIDIGVASGLEEDRVGEYLRSGRDMAAVLQEADLARQRGVRGVPTYGLAGKPARLARDGLPLTAYLLALLRALPTKPLAG